MKEKLLLVVTVVSVFYHPCQVTKRAKLKVLKNTHTQTYKHYI